ncbi:hypothetical protein, partial [Thiolapillus sp.]
KVDPGWGRLAADYLQIRDTNEILPNRPGRYVFSAMDNILDACSSNLDIITSSLTKKRNMSILDLPPM